MQPCLMHSLFLSLSFSLSLSLSHTLSRSCSHSHFFFHFIALSSPSAILGVSLHPNPDDLISSHLCALSVLTSIFSPSTTMHLTLPISKPTNLTPRLISSPLISSKHCGSAEISWPAHI